MQKNLINEGFKKRNDIVKSLLLRGCNQDYLFKYAQKVRYEFFSKNVEVRSVIEGSNLCRQTCNFCGMNRYSSLKRYILSKDDFLNSANFLYNHGRRVIVVQSGEIESSVYFNKLYQALKLIKQKFPGLIIIASFGNMEAYKYKKLRDIGIDRYLLKFETSDASLYNKIKPADTLVNRLNNIKILKKLGFYVSSGNIIGLPGQSLNSIANDLLLLKDLNLSLGSTSVFIPNDMSNYAACLPGNIDIALNFIAILRIICPNMLIPTTSSMELVKKGGQYLGLLAGANVITVHDGTPRAYENNFIIYKKDRYIPKDDIFKIVTKAGLKPYMASLIRNEKNDLFFKLVDRNLHCNRVAVYFEGKRYGYDDLLILVSKFCTYLENHNIKKGDTVLLSLFDSIEFIVVFLSCIRLGILFAPIDPRSSSNEWESIISNTCPRIILATESVYRILKIKKVLKIAEDDSSEYFFSLIKNNKQSNKFVISDENDAAIILYTSGTSADARGVVHTHKNLFMDNYPRTVLKINEKDVLFSCSRMHTSFGLGNSILFPFHFGASVILSRDVPNPFSLEKVLKYRPSLFFAVPSIYELLLNYHSRLRGHFKSVRLCVTSGEKLYADIFRKWKFLYKKKLLECYGITEMCHPVVSNISGKEKINSCGKVIEGFRLKLGKAGRIYCKGASLSRGYFCNEELTKERFINGWFRTDDIARIDNEGFIFLKGRVNSAYKLRGKWVFVLAIEEKLRKSGLIKEVVVVKKRTGLNYYVSLDRYYEKEDIERKIRRYCINNLKIHEWPEFIHIVTKVPRTKNGKIDRNFFIHSRPQNCGL